MNPFKIGDYVQVVTGRTQSAKEHLDRYGEPPYMITSMSPDNRFIRLGHESSGNGYDMYEFGDPFHHLEMEFIKPVAYIMRGVFVRNFNSSENKYDFIDYITNTRRNAPVDVCNKVDTYLKSSFDDNLFEV